MKFMNGFSFQTCLPRNGMMDRYIDNSKITNSHEKITINVDRIVLEKEILDVAISFSYVDSPPISIRWIDSFTTRLGAGYPTSKDVLTLYSCSL